MSSSVTGRRSSGSMTLSSALRICSRLGSIPSLSLAIRQQVMNLLRERRDLLGQLLVLTREIGVRREQLRQLVGLRLDHLDALLGRLRLLVVSLLGRQLLELVPVRLARLREQDQRRGIGGLRREREIQEDERVRIPAERDSCGVDRDPHGHEDRLAEDVLRRSEEPRGLLGAAAERVLSERAVVLGAHEASVEGAADSGAMLPTRPW